MKCLVDMDGLLTDFVSAACKLHKKPFSSVTDSRMDITWRMSTDEFWEPIFADGVSFWEGLNPYSWTTELVALLVDKFRLSDDHCWTICTSPTQQPECKTGKLAWLKKHNIKPPIPPLFKKDKARYATRDTILIDDTERVIDQFIIAGGIGILFPAPWNRYGGFSSDPVAWVRESLDMIGY